MSTRALDNLTINDGDPLAPHSLPDPVEIDRWQVAGASELTDKQLVQLAWLAKRAWTLAREATQVAFLEDKTYNRGYDDGYEEGRDAGRREAETERQ